MKYISQTILLLMLCTTINAQAPLQTVNAVLGDESFEKIYGSTPGVETNEQLRIQTHLFYVEKKLREKNVDHLNEMQQQKRALVLNLLQQYWSNAVFPANYDYKGERRPCFIDKNGNICAVGYLVEKTAGREAAEKINEQHQYDYLLDMNNETVTAWADEYGLTLEECAMIQPSYGWIPTDNTREVPVKTSYGISSGVVGGANAAISILNFSNKNFRQNKTLSKIGLLSGATQIVLGLTNIQKNEIESNFNSTTTVSYKAQNNLSYLNIAVGTTTLISSALNLYLNRSGNDSRNTFNLYSYPGPNKELAMGVGFSRRL